MGHPVLARVAEPVANPSAPEIRKLVADMIETMNDADGAGLAAPQVHVSLRVVIFAAPEGRSDPNLSDEGRFEHVAPLTVLINPELEILGEAREGMWEGCLSVPGMRGWVERPSYVRYRGFDLEGRRIQRTARGFHARVIQHECDHIRGVLYPHCMHDPKKLIFESEIHHYLKQAPE
jgi:peptide deformylase